MDRSVNGASTPMPGIWRRVGTERDIEGPTSTASDDLTGAGPGAGAAWEPTASGAEEEMAARAVGGFSSIEVPKEL